LEVTGASGLMVGRGAIGRPSVFGEIKVGLGWMEHDDLPWVRANAESWHELSPVGQSFAARRWCWDKYIEFSHKTAGLQPRWMQRHAVAFTKGLPGAKKIRAVMHGAPTPEAFADGISSFLSAKSSE
jgi:tRNA-dihydrouridine synthase